MSDYLIVIEETEAGFGAYAPDLPGCVAVADTYDEVEQLMREAIAFHIEGLRTDGESIPIPTSRGAVVSVAA